MEDDSFGALRQPAIGAENLYRLNGQARVVLEVHTRPNLERQFIAAVHFEDIRGVGIQIVVVAIDVIIRVGEIIAGGLIGKAPSKYALLALNGESRQQLPLVREPLPTVPAKSVPLTPQFLLAAFSVRP